MSLWYYADASRQQTGPLDTGELRDLFAGGRIDAATLVWRDGLAQWQALGDFADELGLAMQAPEPQSAASGIAGSEYPDHAPEPSPADVAAPALTLEPSGFASPADASPYAAPLAEVAGVARAVTGAEVIHAGFWKRAAAYFLDTVIVGVLGSIVGAVLGGVMGIAFAMGGASGQGTLVAIQIVSNLLPLAIGAGYFGWFHASPSQASPGKMAVGIKVVRGDGEAITFWRGVARYFASLLSTLPLFAGFVMAAFTRRKQALHDLMCDTLVVDKWAYTHFPERQRREMGTVTWVVLVIGGVVTAFFVLAFGALIVATFGMLSGR